MSLQLAETPSPLPTSAGGPIHTASGPHIIVIRGALYSFGTAARSLSIEDWGQTLGLPQTSSSVWTGGEGDPDPLDPGAAISELRRLAGLTWEQLARVFGVARRSLHFWASGKPINAANEERLRRLLAALRQADRGAADVNRAMLLRDHDGVLPIDLLAEGSFDEFLSLVGRGPGRRRLELTPLSAEAREARKPPPPEELVEALHDRVHRDVGRGRAARTVRNKQRGRD